MSNKTRFLGRESGKSSNRWFRKPGQGTTMHPKGNGASAGDGRTSATSILGKIVPLFRKGGGK